MKRSFAPIIPALALAFLAAGCAEDTPEAGDLPDRAEPEMTELSEEELVELARGIHERVITIDTHIDIPFNFATDEVDPGVRGPFQFDLPKAREGGMDAFVLIAYHGQGERTDEAMAEAWARVLPKYHAIRRMAYEMHPDEVDIAYTADDVVRIHGEGRLVAIIGKENLWPIGYDLDRLQEIYDLGTRYISLTHNGHNQFADAAVERADLGDDGPEWGGLSPLGEQVVDEMNRLGMIVDVSHLSKDAMMHATTHTRAPLIASHSSISAIRDHPRNLDDEQLLAIRANGGVAQTTALGSFVKAPPPERGEAIAALRDEFGVASLAEIQALPDDEQAAFSARMEEINEQFPPADVADYVDHIDYAVDLIGIDHVGISSDFDGGGGVMGWMDASETFNVTLELVRRGYSEEDIRKLWGGNFLRVWQEVERVAAELQAQDN